MRIILASTSPRRRELIKKITDTFECSASSVEEQAIEDRLVKQGGYCTEAELAGLTVRALSRAKAFDVFEKLGRPEGSLVIGADTVVCLQNEILGKPKDREDAVRMLRAQSVEPQRVITGVTLIYKCRKNTIPGCEKGCCADCCGTTAGGTQVRTFTEESLVYFNPLDEAQEARIQAYCDTNEPYDKAGAYGIQLGGIALVDHYEGDVENIIGFPVNRIKREIIELLGCNFKQLT
ncbi:MAG: Maf family protein [Clostridia bacterium]|nr:Maf family protein [Clostridia bacterium]